MTRRSALLAGLGCLAALVLAGIVLATMLWPREQPPRATGPLSAALFAALSGDEGRQSMDAVYDSFIAPETGLEQRAALLEVNGFACAITTARGENGDRQLACTRPTEGTGACAGFTYFTYETAAGLLLNSGGSSYRVAESDRDGARCDSNLAVLEEIEGADQVSKLS